MPISLYIHIPFCRVRCTYCDFNTYTGLEAYFARYTQALVREITLMGNYRNRPPVKTIFIGGGTPTVLPAAQLESILAACRTAFDVLPHAEITTEANPGTVDQSYLSNLRNIGINRISFGVQSFIPGELEMLGRLHSAPDIAKTVLAARNAGFDNLSLDLIFDLPGQTLHGWRETLAQAIKLEPEHLSLYSLTLEEGTVLRTQVEQRVFPSPDSDLAADMYELADKLLDDNGYTQYEISNWSRKNRECRHNLTYWRNEPYLGFGPGAHSSEAGQRWWNIKTVPEYIRAINNASPATHLRPALDDYETIEPRLAMGETMMLGLRLTGEGVSLPDFEARFGQSAATVFGSEIAKLKTLNLLIEEDQRLKLTPQARLLGNQVFMDFLPD